MRIERRDGPTPFGGSYAEALVDDDGRIVEITEYDDAGEPIARTYGESEGAESKRRLTEALASVDRWKNIAGVLGLTVVGLSVWLLAKW